MDSICSHRKRGRQHGNEDDCGDTIVIGVGIVGCNYGKTVLIPAFRQGGDRPRGASQAPLCFDAMRTTLTLDDDVAAVLERLRKSRNASLKDLVNEALRRGLKDMSARTKRREHVQTRSVALGRLRIASLDNIGEVLAIAEGEAYK